MPYKDPRRKRQWEREHRQQRNAKRRMRRLDAGSGHATELKPPHDPVTRPKLTSTWKTILAWAVGIGVVLAALGTKNVTLYGDPAQPPGGKSGT